MQHLFGRMGGRIVSVAILKRVERRLLRDKIVIYRNSDRFLRGRAATGIFRVYKDGSAAIFLRSDPTHYEVMHELMHCRHFKDIGPPLFSQEPLLSREQYVYDALRTRYWKSLNAMEQQHAKAYIRSLGGRV